MATVTLGKTPGFAANIGFYSNAYSAASFFDYDFVSGTSTVYRLYDNGFDDLAYYGSGFTYSGSQPVTGTVTSLVYRVGGNIVANVSGLSVSALALTNAANSGVMSNFYSVLLAANDVISGTALGDTLDFGTNAGNDYMYGFAGADSIYGGLGGDYLFGGDGDDYIEGGSGNDFVSGGAGIDILHGNGDTDTLNYSDSSAGVTLDLVALRGYGGSAQGDSFSGFEIFVGSSYTDTFLGDSANSFFYGGNGNDSFSGGFGADYLGGGAGIDTASYSASTSSVWVYLNFGVAYGGAAQGDTLASIENVVGSALSDVLTGNNLANSLTGGDGDDLLVGGAGADLLSGGLGFDTVSYAQAAAAVTVYLGYNYGSQSDAQGDTFSSIEGLTGSVFADWLMGTSATNFISSGFGSDYVYGDVVPSAAATDYFLFQADIRAGDYDYIFDFGTGGVSDVLYLSATLHANTSFGDYGGYGYAYVDLGGGTGYYVLTTVTGATLQASTYFI